MKIEITAEELKSVIPLGKRNAISAKRLSEKLGVNDRTLRNIIDRARIDGLGICSGKDGYYFASDKSEIESYVKLMESRAKHTFFILKHARKMLKKINEREENERLQKERESFRETFTITI